LNERGWSTVEALAAFSCLLVLIFTTVPLVTAMTENLAASKFDYFTTLAEYELVGKSEGRLVLDNEIYTSYWKGEMWCIAKNGEELSCRE